MNFRISTLKHVEPFQGVVEISFKLLVNLTLNFQSQSHMTTHLEIKILVQVKIAADLTKRDSDGGFSPRVSHQEFSDTSAL